MIAVITGSIVTARKSDVAVQKKLHPINHMLRAVNDLLITALTGRVTSMTEPLNELRCENPAVT